MDGGSVFLAVTIGTVGVFVAIADGDVVAVEVDVCEGRSAGRIFAMDVC